MAGNGASYFHKGKPQENRVGFTSSRYPRSYFGKRDGNWSNERYTNWVSARTNKEYSRLSRFEALEQTFFSNLMRDRNPCLKYSTRAPKLSYSGIWKNSATSWDSRTSATSHAFPVQKNVREPRFSPSPWNFPKDFRSVYLERNNIKRDALGGLKLPRAKNLNYSEDLFSPLAPWLKKDPLNPLFRELEAALKADLSLLPQMVWQEILAAWGRALTDFSCWGSRLLGVTEAYLAKLVEVNLGFHRELVELLIDGARLAYALGVSLYEWFAAIFC